MRKVKIAFASQAKDIQIQKYKMEVTQLQRICIFTS